MFLSPDVDGHHGLPGAIRFQDRGSKDFVVGAFQLRHFFELGRRFRIGNRALGFIGQDISSGIERALKPPEMAGHAIDHRSDVIFLRSVVADGQDLLVRKIGQGALDLRHEPEPAYHVGTLDALDFAGRLPRGHDLAFGLPFADKLLQQLVFLTRSGHFLAGRGALGGSFF